jgi:hypothetical protein
MAEVRAGKVDVIVICKIDRLTRSLTDFARLAEVLDKHGVSFVSVTQQFNTTTSMGRLMLNVRCSENRCVGLSCYSFSSAVLSAWASHRSRGMARRPPPRCGDL